MTWSKPHPFYDIERGRATSIKFGKYEIEIREENSKSPRFYFIHTKSGRSCCISIYGLRILDEGSDWEITHREKKILYKFLKKKSTGSNASNFDYIVMKWNSINKFNIIYTLLPNFSESLKKEDLS